MLLPKLPFALAQPPAPHPADLSPAAAMGMESPRQAQPKWTPAGAALPGFTLAPDLLPLSALPVTAFKPAAALPVMASPMAALAATALPTSVGVGIEATGMEVLFAPMPPQVADFAPVTANVAQSWMPTLDGLPPVATEPGVQMEMAEAIPVWPIVSPRAEIASNCASIEIASGEELSTPLLSGAALAPPAPALAGPVAVELRLQPGRGANSHNATWMPPRQETALPRMTVNAVSYSADPALKNKPALKETPKVRQMPRYDRSEVALWGKGMAAAVAVCAFLWIGSIAIRTNRADSREMAMSGTSGADPIAINRMPETAAGGGLQQKVRGAIARRAKFEAGTDFRDGKDFWNGYKLAWGKGWQRHPDGYAKPGALALLRPTMQLTDYRMEFMGQIENKGLSWSVRSHDTDNYYAMKLNVVAPGLRPIISVVRYPVVNGKRGRKIEIPLPVMVHNQRPFTVAVEVRGNRYVTSIEGEAVDSFSDDALATGGVGFFSEGAERARVYWVKVTNNDDFVGRICAYITGKRGGPAETAFIRGDRFDDETRRRPPVESAAVLPWEWFRRKRAGLNQTATVQTA
jgi:hypothetical protein